MHERSMLATDSTSHPRRHQPRVFTPQMAVRSDLLRGPETETGWFVAGRVGRGTLSPPARGRPPRTEPLTSSKCLCSFLVEAQGTRFWYFHVVHAEARGTPRTEPGSRQGKGGRAARARFPFPARAWGRGDLARDPGTGACGPHRRGTSRGVSGGGYGRRRDGARGGGGLCRAGSGDGGVAGRQRQRLRQGARGGRRPRAGARGARRGEGSGCGRG